jgi:hypothetical protein
MAGFAYARVVENTHGEGLESLRKRLQALHGTVSVGIPEGATEPDGTSTALVAAANEFGVPGHIPERPFLRPGIENNQKEFSRMGSELIPAVAEGKISGAQALDLLGVAAVAKVKDEIVNGAHEPNAPSTIEKKGSDHPLIDTTQMLNSVTFVRNGGGR